MLEIQKENLTIILSTANPYRLIKKNLLFYQ